jgi:hypothetical protein
MVIIKEGDPSKVPNLKFECTVCGCIFSVSRKECRVLRDPTGQKEKLFHDCPTCGCEVKCEIDKRGE